LNHYGRQQYMKLLLFKDERRTSNIERPTSNERIKHKNRFGEAQFWSLTIATQCGLLF
jgi:hypothetical protein